MCSAYNILYSYIGFLNLPPYSNADNHLYTKLYVYHVQLYYHLYLWKFTHPLLGLMVYAPHELVCTSFTVANSIKSLDAYVYNTIQLSVTYGLVWCKHSICVLSHRQHEPNRTPPETARLNGVLEADADAAPCPLITTSPDLRFQNLPRGSWQTTTLGGHTRHRPRLVSSLRRLYCWSATS